MKTSRIAFFTALFLLVGLAASALYLTRNDRRMVFPKKPHGRFVQAPHFSDKNGLREITWTLPKACANSSYEVREVGYKPDSGRLWGGVTSTDCAKIDDGFQCRTEMHPSMNEENGPWEVQASAFDCEGNDYFVSDVSVLES